MTNTAEKSGSKLPDLPLSAQQVRHESGKYESRILGGLLDSYEGSLLSKGKKQRNIHIKFDFTRKSMPEYFDESSLAYEEIHVVLRELERKELVEIVWRRGREGHIVEKVLLREDHVPDVYRCLKRTPRSEQVQRTLIWLKEGVSEEDRIARGFADYLIGRLEAGKSVKEYIEISDFLGTQELFRTLAAIEQNQKSCYLREFSVRIFKNSKKLEKMLGLLGRIFKRFGPDHAEQDIHEILAEYRIYHNPDYVYLKGAGAICFGTEVWDLSSLLQGTGISGDDLDRIKIAGGKNTRRVITIENLTTFFHWSGKNDLVVYLGGYHNSSRRRLLKKIYAQLPKAEYLHFGDIDAGGFEIYRDLYEKTGIPFKTWHMGIEELEKYREYAQPLTENDRKRLEHLLDPVRMQEHPWRDARVPEVLHYMLQTGLKLEQEALP